MQPIHATNGAPSFGDVEAAARRILGRAHRTPVLRSSGLDELAGAEIFFKCENFQRVGAFKFRGACNAIFAADDTQVARGVATHSSGNHAAAVALAARMRGVPAHVVMPRTARAVKQAAVAAYGATITLCEPTLTAREEALAAVVEATGAIFVHPYDDLAVIAGQATAALELIEDAGPLDAIFAPVGGGGLLSGTAVTVAARSPSTAVIGSEPSGADDAARSLAAGRLIPQVAPETIADGLLTSLSQRTFAIIRKHVREIVTVDDAATIRAMRLVWERMKIIIEPSSAVAFAAVLARRSDLVGRRVGVILSGGNVDLGALPWAT